MIGALFTLLATVSASIHIRAEYFGPAVLIYLFKPLTMVFILCIALIYVRKRRNFYGYTIIIGLLFSMSGDIFLMLPSDQFILGLISFLIAHLFYIAAFLSKRPVRISVIPLLPFLLYAVLVFVILSPHLGVMKIPVVVYMLVILLMGWQALERWRIKGGLWTLMAFAGAILFILSDTTLALNRFSGQFHLARIITLSTYFSAQWLIAVSVRQKTK
jgi:uncharacterized membrane protein YhhN